MIGSICWVFSEAAGHGVIRAGQTDHVSIGPSEDRGGTAGKMGEGEGEGAAEEIGCLSACVPPGLLRRFPGGYLTR